MSSLDFDGDFGRTYKVNILHSLLGYDTVNEFALAAVGMTSLHAQAILLVGSGPGNICPAFLKLVLTQRSRWWSLVSRCWRSAGRVSLADGGMHRCELQHQGLTKACNASLKDAFFDLVICHNVLHLFNGD